MVLPSLLPLHSRSLLQRPNNSQYSAETQLFFSLGYQKSEHVDSYCECALCWLEVPIGRTKNIKFS